MRKKRQGFSLLSYPLRNQQERGTVVLLYFILYDPKEDSMGAGGWWVFTLKEENYIWKFYLFDKNIFIFLAPLISERPTRLSGEGEETPGWTVGP